MDILLYQEQFPSVSWCFKANGSNEAYPALSLFFLVACISLRCLYNLNTRDMLANLKPARAKKNYFPDKEKTSGDGRVGTSNYLDLNLPQLKLGLQKGGTLDPLQCFLSIVYPRKEGTWKASQSSSSQIA